MSGLALLGGMVVSPVSTLHRILRAGGASGLLPLCFMVAAIVAVFPITVTRYALLARIDPGMALAKLFASNGFIWMRLINELGVCLAVCVGWWLLARTRGSPVPFADALGTSLYLLVPVALLMLLGGWLQRAGVAAPWLPSHPLDGWWVFEGNAMKVDRYLIKLVVEFAWPVLAALGVAWRMWQQPRSQPAAAGAP